MAITNEHIAVALVCDNQAFGDTIVKLVSRWWDHPTEYNNMFTNCATPLVGSKWLLELNAPAILTPVFDALIEGAPYSDPRLDYFRTTGRVPEEVWTEALARCALTYYDMAATGELVVDTTFPLPWMAERGYEVA